MQHLPTAEVYEKEFTYMPWGILIREVQLYIVTNLSKGGTLLDLLCGPGYLLGKIKDQRPDVVCHGIDLESEFIKYAQAQYQNVLFKIADVRTWESDKNYDAVIVTAGLHHLPREEQESFVEKVSKLIKKDGFAIIGDPYIDDYEDEQKRKVASAKLGYEYLKVTIESGGTDDVIDAAIQVMVNDIQQVEWKSSVAKNILIFKKYFNHVEMHKTWPKEESGYGDYYFILKK